MATDVLTELPPPSRFSDDDLSNFAAPPPPLPSPFLLLPNPIPAPDLLLIAISHPSLFLLPSSTSPAGALLLPDAPLSGAALASPSLSPPLYLLPDSAVAAAFSPPVPAARAHAVAKCLVGGLRPRKVVIFDTIRPGTFRGRLPTEGAGAVAFKIETLEQRRCPEGTVLSGVGYYPSGSVADGLGAALLGRCQVEGIKGTLCLTWPEERPVVALLRSVLRRLVPGGGFDAEPAAYRAPDSRVNSELYT